MTIHWKAVEQYFTVVLIFNFTKFVILENLSILDLALRGVKGLKNLLELPPLDLTRVIPSTIKYAKIRH